METTINDAGPFEKVVTFEVLEERLEPAKNSAARQLSKEMTIPGFRSGKAPRRVVETAVGSERLRAEAIDSSLGELVSEALDATELEVAATPAIESISDTENGVEISVKVAIWPVLDEAPNYVGREIEVPSPHLTDADLDEQIDRIRDQFSELETVDRDAAQGDYVSIDMSASTGEEEVPEANASDLMIPVGGGSFIEGMDEAVDGLSAGEEASFEGKLPEGFGEKGGTTVTYTVIVKEVRAKLLPDLTDEWVSEVTEVETVADLRADIGSRLQQTKFETSWNAYRTNLVDALVDEFTTEIPESILTGEMEEVLHRFSHSLSEQDIEMDNYLDISGQSQEEFVDDIRKTGTRNVQTELLLDAIADDAGLTVTDEELDDILNNIGEPDGKAADEIRETLSVGQKKKLNSDILRQKAHEHMIKAAVPLDEDGNIIDYDAVFAQLQEQRQAHMDELQAKASETENTTSEDSGEEE